MAFENASKALVFKSQLPLLYYSHFYNKKIELTIQHFYKGLEQHRKTILNHFIDQNCQTFSGEISKYLESHKI